QIAYFFFMASVPMLIVLTQVLGIFDVSMDFIRDWLETHLSTEMGSFLQSLFSASSTALSSFFMILLALWASSSLAFSLSRLTTYTISYGRYRFSFFTERLKAIPIAALSILAVAVTLVGYVYGELIAKRILQNTYIEGLISGLKTPVLVMLFFIVILANYYLLPRIRVPVTAVLPGAVFATLGILAVTWIYSVYIARAAKYNVLYGAFSNIVAMMLWFYLISWVLCIGMMFNKSWDIHMRRGRLTPAKIKEYLIKQYGANGEEMWHKLIIGEYDMVDRSLDSLAVRMSRKFDPGYDEKREREIAELIETMQVRERIEQEIETRRAELESWDDDQ
ncbi:MAG: YihY/virulence factor BrkB family protein, partial [Mogibacterium sp.]|nr:YihY/virulence factor BrkB family protein [Mogibacterium sp.]